MKKFYFTFFVTQMVETLCTTNLLQPVPFGFQKPVFKERDQTSSAESIGTANISFLGFDAATAPCPIRLKFFVDDVVVIGTPIAQRGDIVRIEVLQGENEDVWDELNLVKREFVSIASAN